MATCFDSQIGGFHVYTHMHTPTLFKGAQPHALCFPFRLCVCLAALKSLKPSLIVGVGTSW